MATQDLQREDAMGIGLNEMEAHYGCGGWDNWQRDDALKHSPTSLPLSSPHVPVCPRCGKSMVKREGSRGAFLGCSGFPTCKGSRSIQEGAPERLCGKVVMARNADNNPWTPVLIASVGVDGFVDSDGAVWRIVRKLTNNEI
jgi:hypothetical protein